MAFNAKQFAAKKKRPYTGPPRPNLMTHEKKIKEAATEVDMLRQLVFSQKEEIARLKNKINGMEYTISLIQNRVNKGKV